MRQSDKTQRATSYREKQKLRCEDVMESLRNEIASGELDEKAVNNRKEWIEQFQELIDSIDNVE